MTLREILEKRIKLYSEELGITLRTCQSAEVAKWFLASLLLAKRISRCSRSFYLRHVKLVKRLG